MYIGQYISGTGDVTVDVPAPRTGDTPGPLMDKVRALGTRARAHPIISLGVLFLGYNLITKKKLF